MRKLVVLSFVTLDGILQAPGGEQEDTSGGFKYGGWSVPFWSDEMGEVMGKQMGHEFSLLLGRNTYDIFHGAWPQIDPSSPINSCIKYLVSSRPAPADDDIWKNTRVSGPDIPKWIRGIKEEAGPEIQVHGSPTLIQLLLEHDLVDELWLKIYPVTIGKGKRLWGEGTRARSFKLTHSQTTSAGVIVANYVRDGEVRTGTIGV